MSRLTRRLGKVEEHTGLDISVTSVIEESKVYRTDVKGGDKTSTFISRTSKNSYYNCLHGKIYHPTTFYGSSNIGSYKKG